MQLFPQLVRLLPHLSRRRELVRVEPEALLNFHLSVMAVGDLAERLKERRAASLAFYESCMDGSVDLERNPLIDWMQRYHPKGWHGASSPQERVELCGRFRDLFDDIRESGIREPMRLLEPALFGQHKWHNFHDGTNRVCIAICLNLSSVPCLVHPSHRQEISRLGLHVDEGNHPDNIDS